MFEIFLPYVIGTALGIVPSDPTPPTEITLTKPAVTDVAEARLPEDQTPTGQFTTATEVKPILEMTQAQWVGVRNYEGQDYLYFTNLLAWRCGLWSVHYGLNGLPATTPLEIEPCYDETNAPNALMVTDGILPFLIFEPGSISSISIKVTYDDGSEQSVDYERTKVLIP